MPCGMYLSRIVLTAIAIRIFYQTLLYNRLVWNPLNDGMGSLFLPPFPGGERNEVEGL